MDKVVSHCSEFKISLQYGFYITDHWAVLYDDLEIAFVKFYIVRKGLPCTIYMVCLTC